MPETLITEKPFSAVAEDVLKYCRGGNVSVLAEDADAAEGLIRILTRVGSTVRLLPPGSGVTEDTHYLVAMGGEDTVFEGKYAAKKRRLVAVPNAPYRSCFNGRIAEGFEVRAGTCPSLVVLSPEGGEFAAAAGLAGLFTDIMDICAAGGNDKLAELGCFVFDAFTAPYDPARTPLILCKAETAFSLGGYTGGMECVAAVIARQARGETRSFCTLFTYYLLNTILFLFTKKELSGILLLENDGVRMREQMGCLGTRRPAPAAAKGKPLPTHGVPVLSRDALAALGARITALCAAEQKRRCPVAEGLDALLLAASLGKWDGLLHGLAESGWVEGIRRNWA